MTIHANNSGSPYGAEIVLNGGTMSDTKLAKVCPVCKAAPGGKCLEPVKDGQRYIEQPHKERWFEKLEDAVGTAIGEAMDKR